MRILVGDEWSDGFLDPWKSDGRVRISVRRWHVVEHLDDLYFQHEPSFRTLIDYGREVGPVEVARKVLSRLSEGARNQKCAAVGLGRVIDGGDLEAGTVVAFFAACAPRCAERVVVDPTLVWEVAESVDDEYLEFSEAPSNAFRRWSGWRPESGVLLTELDDLEELTFEVLADLAPGARLVIEPPTPVCERQVRPPPAKSAVRACLLGFGHYARTVVLPNLPDEIDVVSVHEIDPLMAPDEFPSVDTSGDLRPEERYDVVFVAGYHASHARLAAEALKRGSWVVCEKPIATTRNGLRNLMPAVGERSRYFAGFHRRYSQLNDWVFADLKPSENNPLSYHSIVHEVKLPARHWYQWPSSGSRLLSNGCHWVDHFLFLNGFAEVDDYDAFRGPHGEMVCRMSLVNGAFFTLTLTDRGSDRLGVREHTEIRVADARVVIEDFKSYEAEGAHGLIRREKFHKLAAHRDMYRSIGAKILDGAPGDAPAGIERSARAVLDLEEMLDATDHR